jgi:hypothetical protein
MPFISFRHGITIETLGDMAVWEGVIKFAFDFDVFHTAHCIIGTFRHSHYSYFFILRPLLNGRKLDECLDNQTLQDFGCEPHGPLATISETAVKHSDSSKWLV